MKDRLIKLLMIKLWEALVELREEPIAVVVLTNNENYILAESDNAE